MAHTDPNNIDSHRFKQLYRFLKSADEDEAEIVCLKCKKTSHNITEFDCDDEHFEHTLQNTHDSPGVYYYINCLEFLADSEIIELEN